MFRAALITFVVALLGCLAPGTAADASTSAADAGPIGSCARCGVPCAKQLDCSTPMAFSLDKPLPLCAGGLCRLTDTRVFVNVVLQLDNDWFITSSNTRLRSMILRFVKRQALDGARVSCADVRAAASGSDPKALERQGRFNLQSMESYPLNGAAGPALRFNVVGTLTGADYLLYAELWDGPLGSDFTYPTGARLGAGCDDGPSLSPVVASDDCGDGGTCRGFAVPVALQL